VAWDSVKNPNDIISSSDYNASVSDQKSRGIPSQEAKSGSNCTGTDGAAGRTLALANATAIKAAGRMIFRNGSFLDPNDYSISNSPPNDVVTFSGVNIFDADRIIVIYFL
jgi:hypothetical protein